MMQINSIYDDKYFKDSGHVEYIKFYEFWLEMYAYKAYDSTTTTPDKIILHDPYKKINRKMSDYKKTLFRKN